LLDDHALFRDSLSRLLESESDFEVVACCGRVPDALDVLAKETIDLVLLDFDLGDDQGNSFLSAARRAGFEGRVLLVTAGMSETDASVALERGASGIFLKHDSPISLAQAIRLVRSGGTWLESKLIQKMASKLNRHDDTPIRPSLTTREHQVLEGIFEGLSNKEIAARLNASESAIKATLQQLFDKLHVRTRSQLVRVALEGSYLR
jgi:DNA-binding NarL/FixJ family response regulator